MHPEKASGSGHFCGWILLLYFRLFVLFGQILPAAGAALSAVHQSRFPEKTFFVFLAARSVAFAPALC